MCPVLHMDFISSLWSIDSTLGLAAYFQSERQASYFESQSNFSSAICKSHHEVVGRGCD
jgi:hypothetical protein